MKNQTQLNLGNLASHAVFIGGNLKNCHSGFLGESMRGIGSSFSFAISQEAFRNSPSVIRGKSKKTRGLFSWQ